jgi:hypothetical protein
LSNTGALKETRSPSQQYFVRLTVSKLLCYSTPPLVTSSLRSGRYTCSFRVSTEVKQCSSEFGVPRGHESLTIILHFMQILESVLDPDSTVFSLGKGRKTSLRLAPRHRTETFQSLKQNTSHMRRVLFYLGAPCGTTLELFIKEIATQVA